MVDEIVMGIRMGMNSKVETDQNERDCANVMKSPNNKGPNNQCIFAEIVNK